MAKASTVKFAREVLTPAQFKAWKAMPVKLSKSELAAGKRPGGRKAAPKAKPARGSRAKSKAQHAALMKTLRKKAFKGLDYDAVDYWMEYGGMSKAKATKTVKLLQQYPRYPEMSDDHFDWVMEQVAPKKAAPKGKLSAGYSAREKKYLHDLMSSGMSAAAAEDAMAEDDHEGILPWSVEPRRAPLKLSGITQDSRGRWTKKNPYGSFAGGGRPPKRNPPKRRKPSARGNRVAVVKIPQKARTAILKAFASHGFTKSNAGYSPLASQEFANAAKFYKLGMSPSHAATSALTGDLSPAQVAKKRLKKPTHWDSLG